MFKKKSLILILLLPVFLTGCARAQGALAPTGESSPAQEMAPFESNPDQFLPQVEPASLEPIINKVIIHWQFFCEESFMQIGQPKALPPCEPNFTPRFVPLFLGVVFNY